MLVLTVKVAPHVGAWIETIAVDVVQLGLRGRPSCRGVD